MSEDHKPRAAWRKPCPFCGSSDVKVFRNTCVCRGCGASGPTRYLEIGPMTDQTAEARHEYPSNYEPGTHWATDAAWEILDTVKPGVISIDVRSYLAGLITGRLLKERDSHE